MKPGSRILENSKMDGIFFENPLLAWLGLARMFVDDN